MKKFYIILTLSFLAIIGFSFFLTSGLEASSTDKFYGWGESASLGLVSFNCTSASNQNSNSCTDSNFGVDYDEITGYLSGNAWSEYAGWLSFNESGCPSGSCQPKIDLTTGKLSGWARVLSMKNPSDTETNTATGTSEEWADGWISLSGTGYGPSFNLTTGAGSGYAWGSNGIGWVSFGNVNIFPTAPTLKLKANGNYEFLTVNSGDSIILSAVGYELDLTKMGTASGDPNWTGNKNCPSSMVSPTTYPAVTLINNTQDSVLETLTLDCTKKAGGIISSSITVNIISSVLCSEENALNFGGPLPCVFDPERFCGDMDAINYGKVLPCEYPSRFCEDSNAKNYQKLSPCVYEEGKCLEEQATNYGGNLPCEFVANSCTDSNAANYGDSLPCIYECAKVDMTTYNAEFPWCYCPNHPGDLNCALYCSESAGRCSKKPHYIEK